MGRAAGLSNDFLMQCMDLAPTCTRAAEYAKAVLDGYQRRQLQALGEKLQTEALCAGSTADQLLTEARSTLDDLASTPGRCSVKSARDSLLDFMTFRAEVQQGKRQAIRTGFPSLDRILGGFAQGGFYVMAARPGVGKSALGIALADMMARDRRVLYVSLEMTEAELNARRVAAVSDITCTFGKLLFGKTTEEQDAAIANACGVQTGMTQVEVEDLVGKLTPGDARNRFYDEQSLSYRFWDRSGGEPTLMEMEWNAAVENDEIIFETAQDAPSFRGICLGDTIDTVLEKFPCADRELKKQQSQALYGQEGDADYASLHLIADSYYSLSFYVDGQWRASIDFSRVQQRVFRIVIYGNGYWQPGE